MLGPDTQIGHYRILRALGSGGMADVYEAHDTVLDRQVALKILPPELSRNPQLVARFQKEVRAAAKLNHRNIVTVFEVGQQDNYHFFSMRLLTGGDLRRRIERGLAPIEALAILRELADAFAHAHQRGFVHRDVKPENILFDEQGFPVLTDFGIAKALDTNTRMTRTGVTVGTPRYLAPEQASGKPVDARADLYSLGVVLYEMLTGRPPYEADESLAVIFKHVTEPVPRLQGELARLQPLLDKLMAKDPAQRLGSATELTQMIDAAQPHNPTAEGPRPSSVKTAENPLVAQLLEPSPLRTAPPLTPRPGPTSSVSTAEISGELLVRPAETRTVAHTPATAPRTAPVEPRADPAPSTAAVVDATAVSSPRKNYWGTAAAAMLVVGAGALAWILREPATPAPATVPAATKATPAAAPTRNETRQQREIDDAARPKAAAQASREAELKAARLRQQEQVRQDRIRREEAVARQRAEADRIRREEAAARQRAEAEAKLRQEQEAAERQAKLHQEEEARKKAAADAVRKKQEEERLKQQSTDERKTAEEEKARERARRPAGF